MYTTPRYQAAQQPILLTDDVVKAKLSKARLILTDGFIPVEGRIIGWQRTDKGSLGAIVVNPLTNGRFLFVVDFATGKPRNLGIPRTRH